MHGNEEIGVLVAGEADTGVQFDEAVGIARQRHAVVAAMLERLTQLERGIEHDVLLANAGHPDRARIAPAVSGVDDDGAARCAAARPFLRRWRCHKRRVWREIKAQFRGAPRPARLAHEASRRFEVQHHARIVGVLGQAAPANHAAAGQFTHRRSELRVRQINHEAIGFAQEEGSRRRRRVERERHARRNPGRLDQHPAHGHRRVRPRAAARHGAGAGEKESSAVDLHKRRETTRPRLLSS